MSSNTDSPEIAYIEKYFFIKRLFNEGYRLANSSEIIYRLDILGSIANDYEQKIVNSQGLDSSKMDRNSQE